MMTSEKCYGAAVGLVLLIAALGDSENFGLWTVIAVIGTVAAMIMVYAGRAFEDRERQGGFYRKWKESNETDGDEDDNISQDCGDEVQSGVQTDTHE